MKNLLFLFLCIPSLGFAQYAVGIIGGGPSGLSAGAVCQDLGFQTVLFEEELQTSSQNSPVTFWPGIGSPHWEPILKATRDTFTKSGGTILEKEVVSINTSGNGFVISTKRDSFRVDAVIMATGRHAQDNSFPIKRSERILTNPWIGKTFSPKDSVIIIGQGNPFYYACLKAASSGSKIFAVPYRKNTSLDPLFPLFPGLSVIQTSSISEISATQDKARMSYSLQGSKLQKEASYIIVAEERIPSSALVKNLCSLDSSGTIVTALETGETSLPGLFACGEVTEKKELTGLQAAAEGQKTGMAVAYYLVENGIAPKKLLLPAKEEKPSQGTTGTSVPQSSTGSGSSG